MLHRYKLKNLSSWITESRFQVWFSGLGLDSEGFCYMYIVRATLITAAIYAD